jgi:hypothetical protein
MRIIQGVTGRLRGAAVVTAVWAITGSCVSVGVCITLLWHSWGAVSTTYPLLIDTNTSWHWCIASANAGCRQVLVFGRESTEPGFLPWPPSPPIVHEMPNWAKSVALNGSDDVAISRIISIGWPFPCLRSHEYIPHALWQWRINEGRRVRPYVQHGMVWDEVIPTHIIWAGMGMNIALFGAPAALITGIGLWRRSVRDSTQ